MIFLKRDAKKGVTSAIQWHSVPYIDRHSTTVPTLLIYWVRSWLYIITLTNQYLERKHSWCSRVRSSRYTQIMMFEWTWCWYISKLAQGLQISVSKPNAPKNREDFSGPPFSSFAGHQLCSSHLEGFSDTARKYRRHTISDLWVHKSTMDSAELWLPNPSQPVLAAAQAFKNPVFIAALARSPTALLLSRLLSLGEYLFPIIVPQMFWLGLF